MMSKSDSLGIASTYFLHAGMLDAPLKRFTMLLGERGYQPECVFRPSRSPVPGASRSLSPVKPITCRSEATRGFDYACE